MPELELLYHLQAVAKHGTLSAAAEALHISQPSLTRSMKKLEAEFGIPLFDRAKNKVSLNEAGMLAVREARRVTEAAEEMNERMAGYARSQRTISVGSCAPAPLWMLTPALSQQYSDMVISAEMKPPEELPLALRAGTYQLIVMDRPVEEQDLVCRKYTSEHLCISLPSVHPLAQKQGIYLSELGGETMLLFSELGVWQKLRDEKMRDIHFIVQTQRETFRDLIGASALPHFFSNLTGVHHAPNRTERPILDPEATIDFYLCACNKYRRLLDCVISETETA